jgi:hypothetical protein
MDKRFLMLFLCSQNIKTDLNRKSMAEGTLKSMRLWKSAWKHFLAQGME